MNPERQQFQQNKELNDKLVNAIEKQTEVFKGINKIVGNDGDTPVADVDYPSKETIAKQIEAITPKKGVTYYTPAEVEAIKKDILSRIDAGFRQGLIDDTIKGIKIEDVDYARLEQYICDEIAKIPKPEAEVVDINSIIIQVLAKIPEQKEVVVDYKSIFKFCADEIIRIEKSRPRQLQSAGPSMSLGDINNVNLDGVTVGQVLSWNGTIWVPITVSGSGGAVDSVNGDTGNVIVDLQSVTDAGTTTTDEITVGGIVTPTIKNGVDTIIDVASNRISNASGAKIDWSTASVIDLYDEASGFKSSLDTSALTADRVHTLPDVSGTFVATAGLTSGSLPFMGASGLLVEDNTNLNWNNTLKKLTVATTNIAAVSSGVTAILNGNPFVSGLTSWTFVSGWSYSSNGALHASGNTNTLSQSFTATVGAMYRVQYTLGSGTSGSLSSTVTSSLLSTTISTSATSGTKTGYFYADESTMTITFTPSSTQTRLITAVKVEKITPADSPINLNYFVEMRSASNQSVYLGVETGQNSLAAAGNNTIVGQQAFRRNTTGGSNTGFGFGVLDSNITGSNNTAFGNSALMTNISGILNVAIGNTSLFANTTGQNNVGIGSATLSANTTGNFNIGIGADSGKFITTGLSNTLIGYSSGGTLVTGQNNIFIGSSADWGSDTSSKLVIGNFMYADLVTKEVSFRYDASNEVKIGVSSTGGVTFDAVGSGAGFTFSDDVSVPDEAYGAGWNGSLEVPTKNAVYDKIETLQPLSANLTIYAGITPSANTQSLLGAADYAAMRTQLGLVIGTNVQAYDADLDTWATKTAPSGVVLGTTDTQVVTNKQISKRVITTTDDATAVIDYTLTDVYELSAIANNTTFTLTGTPTDAQEIWIRWKDAGVSKTLTWTGFTAIGITLPTATTAGKWGYVKGQYNSAAGQFHVLATGTEA